ncbi:winged helix-turn-helix domain-containing protein [Lacimicrobium alkaliphilum]|uniref:winged helix-turn-helix domain-containing protein n=1 Tax=Lacimicrobium alkaliphilum TaxID=1526571 RepID=UPI0018D263FE|nr:winged helix-turn-helix domain-containing protein [Lacimicrobium alkaliphilum]
MFPQQSELAVAPDGQKIQLESQLMALLSYLVAHPDQIVTRDQLAEALWSGMVVEDNTISKAVTRLRQVLGDDSRAPTFIRTIPKRGYRLIARVEPVHQVVTGRQRTLSAARLSSILICAIGLLLLAWLIVRPSPPTLYQSQLLTSLQGLEINPSFSLDGHQFAFIHKTAQTNQLMVNRDNRPVAIRKLDADASFPQWSPTADSLLIAAPKSCEILLLERPGLPEMAQRSWPQCTTLMLPVLWQTDGSGFYFVHDNQLFRQSLATLIPDPMPQVALEGSLRWFDVSARGDRIALLYVDTRGHSLIRIKHLDSGQLIKEMSLTYTISAVHWHAQGDSLMHVSEHPSQQVIRHFLNGRQRVVSSAEFGYLDQVVPIGSSQALAVTSHYVNRNLTVWDNEMTPLAVNSSTPDYLGILSSQTDQLAFASKRSGSAQIWLRDTNNSVRQISQFEPGLYIYDLAWSPDNAFLLVNASQSLFVIDVDNGETVRLFSSDKQISSLGWLDKDQIFYISGNEANSGLFTRPVHGSEPTLLAERIAQAAYITDTDQWYVRPSGQDGIYAGNTPELADNLVYQSSPGRLKSWQVDGQQLYTAELDKNDRQLVFYRIEEGLAKRLYQQAADSVYAQFRVAGKNKLILTTITTNEANIVGLYPVQ